MKMSPPLFRKIAARDIPASRRKSGHWIARVVAGELEDIRGPVRTPTPLLVLRISILQDTGTEIPMRPDFNACCYVIRGTAHTDRFGQIPEGKLIHYKSDGNTIALEAQGETELLLLAGKPLNEPVASHGPFVMNRYQELHQALTDYQSGRMGRLVF
jgi:quercetin 2,3-dioxygenase